MKKHNQAMILAAGVGSRLDPLTSQLPKPLCPILGKPVMEHIILLCKEHGFTNLAANTHVMADKIKYYFNNENHPIVFINTANHAMSCHDTNHRLWKWEYIPWEIDSAIVYDEKSRDKVDRFFWPK